MKKLLSLCVCLLLVGCSSGVTQEEYDSLVKKNEELSSEITKLNEEIADLKYAHDDGVTQYEATNVKVSGGFVATVREKMPDYVLDDSTLSVVVLQWFQGNMFILDVDNEIVSELEIGKAYYFEIESVVLDKDSYGLSVPEVQKLLNGNIASFDIVKVKSYRNPTDDEGGINSDFIAIEEVK